MLLSRQEHNDIAELLFFFYSIAIALYKKLFFWLLLILPTLIIFYFSSILADFKKSLKQGLLYGIILKIIGPSIVILIGYYALDGYRNAEVFDYPKNITVQNSTGNIRNLHAIDQKQRGIHFFSNRTHQEDIDLLVRNNFEWITLTPFINQELYNLPSLQSMPDEQFEKMEGRYRELSAYTKTRGVKIMLKPHIWLHDGKFRGDIEMKNEADWQRWFEEYSIILLKFALLAEKLEIEQFCIGTELEKSAIAKPELWIHLINEVKKVYTGKITYAANWNKEFEEVVFWDQLDYIGIQAYFPLSKGKPDLLAFENSWQVYTQEIKLISEKYDRPVLFTELGYRSLQGTALKPWKWVKIWDYFSRISRKEQYLCYQSFFNTIWKEDWFHGIHIWEWQSSRDTKGNNTSFTIQNKPVLNLIAEEFYFNSW